ncbi:MAG TPA: HAMP domain-containing sensor histidine kinase [Allosphingosinicella sp.]
MRFDDMIATVLAQGSDRPDGRAAQWRQLVDLLAQRRARRDSMDSDRAFAALRALRGTVDAPIRRLAAQSLAGLAVDPDLVAFYAEDSPPVAAPLIAGARLHAEEWVSLLPRLGPAARALLRHRADLDPEVKQALSAFGASDFVLESSAEAADATEAAPPAPVVPDESQIRELVARIEAYRKHREEHPIAPQAADALPGEGFRWETGADGLIIWVEGAPRGPLIGLGIAAAAGPGQAGVDGQAAGGFEKRAPFRDARFVVAGEGAAAGDWRISGIPYFDPRTGAFQGYRGTARRPRLDEIATAIPGAAAGVFGTQFPADSLRQLIHELRTPLNAIIGFAEMIEGQYMGPAALPYRGRATSIVEQARGLLGAVDDLDTAARIESSRFDSDEGMVDAEALLTRLHASYSRVAAGRGSAITADIAPDLPPARVEPAAAERMFARLLAGTIGLAREGETIAMKVDSAMVEGRPTLRIAVDRPQAIAGLDESDLLDPGYSPEGDWPGAPALGLGFALRLIRNLAEAVGGSLEIQPARFVLNLRLSAATATGLNGGAA